MFLYKHTRTHAYKHRTTIRRWIREIVCPVLCSRYRIIRSILFRIWTFEQNEEQYTPNYVVSATQHGVNNRGYTFIYVSSCTMRTDICLYDTGMHVCECVRTICVACLCILSDPYLSLFAAEVLSEFITLTSHYFRKSFQFFSCFFLLCYTVILSVLKFVFHILPPSIQHGAAPLTEQASLASFILKK